MKLFGKKKRKSKAKASKKKTKPAKPETRQEPWKPIQIPKIEIPPEAKIEPKPFPTASDTSRKEFIKMFRALTNRWNVWDIWSDFVTMFACAISNGVDKSHYEQREAVYLERIRRYSKEEQDLFPKLAGQTVLALDENPEQDFLGSIYMELGLGNAHRGQFFTPYHVCQLMAEISESDIVGAVQKNGYASINDPCCGSGAMLIAGVNTAKQKLEKAGLNFQHHVLVVGQDVDHVAVMMAYIQLSLLGIAGYFKVGNSLTKPIADGDSRENYWFTPMYFSVVWQYRLIFQQVARLTKGGDHSIGGDQPV